MGKLKVFTRDSLIDQTINPVRGCWIVALQDQQFPATGNAGWTAFKGFVG